MDGLRIFPIRPAASARPGADWILRSGLGVMAFLLAAGPGPALPGPATAAAPRADGVRVSLDQAQSGCHVRGDFHAPVSRAIAWQVLTDYGGIARFVHSVRESRLEEGPGGERRLRQDAVGSAFMIRHRVRVLLQLDEIADRRIGFRDVLGKDFRVYAGEWRSVPDTSGVRIEYELRAEPSSPMLRMFCRGSLLRGAQDLLGEVRAEMVRRETARRETAKGS